MESRGKSREDNHDTTKSARSQHSVVSKASLSSSFRDIKRYEKECRDRSIDRWKRPATVSENIAVCRDTSRNNQCVILCVPPIRPAPLDRPVEGRRLHKVRSARRGRAGDPRAERHHTEGLLRADHRQVRQQSQQQQQGDTAVSRLSRTTGHATLRRADPPSNRPLQVHSTVATIQVPTRLYSLYPRILSLSLVSLSLFLRSNFSRSFPLLSIFTVFLLFFFLCFSFFFNSIFVKKCCAIN